MNALSPVTPQAVDKQALADLLAASSSTVIRRLAIASIIALILIVGWAALVPIASGAVAPGELIVENKRKTLQHPDGGIVRQIAVHEGSKIRQGALLLRLDDTEAQLNVQVLQSQADSLRAEQAARRAELVGADKVDFPADLLARDKDPDVRAALDAQRAAFKARRSNVSGKRSQLGEQVSQLDQEIQGTQAQRTSSSEQIALLESEIKDVEGLYAKGLTTRARLLALQRAAAQAKGDREALRAQAAKLRAQTAETHIQSMQVERDAGQDAANSLREVQGELVQVLEKLAAAKRVLARTEIRAPVSGTVVGLQVTTLGGVVRAGEPLMDIVPAGDRLVVRARIPPMHADNIQIGQHAFVRFDAAGLKSAPTVEGTVQKLSADALTDARSGQTYFEAIITIPDRQAAALPRDLLKPGLPAEVLMKTGERTALAYLFAPITRATFHAMRE
jgi:HlyD family type I secretion membrane fusion protein